ADDGSPESGLADAVLLPQLQRDRVEALQQIRQAARDAFVNPQFVQHGLPQCGVDAPPVCARNPVRATPASCQPRRSPGTSTLPREERRMRIHNIYVDGNGETHWRDIEVEWMEERNAGKLSRRLPATGIIFRETSGDYDLDWHPAPRRQYIINLDGGVKITASDGEALEIGAGEVILVEDVSGKGHLSKSIGGQMRHSIFVPVE